MAGIKTTYKNSVFRSRLEARWAAMFDLLGWRWVYEPFDADGYIPDFAIVGERPLLVEVKPALTAAELEPVIERVLSALLPHGKDVLFLGATPVMDDADGYMGVPAAGWLAEFMQGDGIHADDELVPASAMWASCLKCSLPGVYHEYQSFACRPCGHHDGDSYLGNAPDVMRLWNEAGSLVQWRKGG